MPIEFTCKNCQQQLRVPDGSGGRNAKCPHCESISVIPEAPTQRNWASAGPAIPSELKNQPTASPFAETTYDEHQPMPRSVENPYAATSLAADEAEPLGFLMASRWARLAAKLIDIAATAALGFLVMIATTVIIEISGLRADRAVVVIASILTSIGFMAIPIVNWYLTAKSGTTIGKKLLGCQVVLEMNADPPGFVNGVFLRSWLPSLIGLIVPFFGLIDGLFIFGDNMQCLHDMMASTRVVQKRSQHRNN